MSAAPIVYRVVTIPGCVQHAGLFGITIALPWTCIQCGAPRGEPYKTVSYDGSMRLGVDGWINACGHVEKYCDVREWLAKQAPKGAPEQ